MIIQGSYRRQTAAMPALGETANDPRNLSSAPLFAHPGGSIPLLKVFIAPTAGNALTHTLYSGYIGEGNRVREFEQELARRCGNPRVLAVNSGTSALQLALRLAGTQPDDEVISTPMTCMATNAAIALSGARIVWADIDPWTGNLTPESISRRLTSRTRAIMVMHWGGYPCDMDAIGSLARQAGIPVIEDACHAFGARYAGQPIGCHSDYVCFSFQAVKILTTGDGGALLTRSASDDERGRRLRWYGLERRTRCGDRFFEQDVTELGFKFHMNDLAATLGLEQLPYVAGNLSLARANAARYDSALQGLRSVHPLRPTDPLCDSSHWLYTLRVPCRASFIKAMHRKGISASPVHRRNDTYTVFREFAADLPGVSTFDREHVCIPVGWWIGEREADHIIQAVHDFDAQCHKGGRCRRAAQKTPTARTPSAGGV